MLRCYELNNSASNAKKLVRCRPPATGQRLPSRAAQLRVSVTTSTTSVTFIPTPALQQRLLIGGTCLESNLQAGLFDVIKLLHERSMASRWPTKATALLGDFKNIITLSFFFFCLYFYSLSFNIIFLPISFFFYTSSIPPHFLALFFSEANGIDRFSLFLPEFIFLVLFANFLFDFFIFFT